MDKIQHVVVVMFENRSFDNLLGYLYADQGNQPAINQPAPPAGQPPTFDGINANCWNPSNTGFFDANNPEAPVKVQASCGTSGAEPYRVPDPDPHEEFVDMGTQLFGTNVSPVSPNLPGMLGFLVDYASVSSPAAPSIMECYSPAQLSMLSGLAKQFAVCDRWFASVPAQTWPNRAFMHAGTSLGHVNNDSYNPLEWNAKTIFQVLQEAGKTWNVFCDSAIIPSLTGLQFPGLWGLLDHVLGMDNFKQQAATGTLPAYSFIEPSLLLEPNDQHPPHDVSQGEAFLLEIWKAITAPATWDKVLLIITHDEHGGCYDHVPPPWGATPPDNERPGKWPGNLSFDFDRFGVRVPAVVVSPFIEAGTVFRSATATPYDHTSILATVLDWLSIPRSALGSQRVAAAPTLAPLLTRDAPRTAPTGLLPAQGPGGLRLPSITPLNDVQRSLVVAHLHRQSIQTQGRAMNDAELAAVLSGLKTVADAVSTLMHSL